MENKVFLKDYILTYDSLNKYINLIMNKNNTLGIRKVKKDIIGYTNFNYPIYSLSIGNGNNHVVIIGGTHGCEIATVYFALEMLFTLIKDQMLNNDIFKKYTFHIIPVLNPEGFKISSSIVSANFKNKNTSQIEEISKMYVRAYMQDDENAIAKTKTEKLYKKVLHSSINYIDDAMLKKSVNSILVDCGLDEKVLPIWSSNGIGIDPNANSIHKFDEIIKYRIKYKYGKLRYNDIPTFKPSPIGYPGYEPLTLKCPETLSIYKYISKLYSNNLISNNKEKLTAIFSYHTTGGEIYSTPDVKASNYQKKLHEIYTNEYTKYTNYFSINESFKYGFMDYFRLYLEGVLSLTIELSKVSGNPISCFTNFKNFNEEIINNKLALFKILESF